MQQPFNSQAFEGHEDIDLRKLGHTLAKLSEYRRRWSALLHDLQKNKGIEAAAEHLTELTGFGSNPGALRMFTFAPRRLAPSPALVVVLHGCTQTAAVYDLGAGWSTLAERYGFVLLFPEQTTANNPKNCFNWFLPDDVSREQGEALSIRQMIEKAIVAHGIDRRRVFINGLSAGGAMTAAMLAIYPEVFAAGAIIAGLPYGTANNVQQAFESMFQGRSRLAGEWGNLVRGASSHRGPWPRVSIWHGDADATVKPQNAESLAEQWTNVHGIRTPPVKDSVDGYPHRVWRKDGAVMVESYTITGMAHGTPLAAQHSDQACGRSGPFLLEAGISSSYHIATFFELTGEKCGHDFPCFSRERVHSAALVPDGVEIIPDERVEILNGKADKPNFGDPIGGRIDVMSVITNALTSAGLMKPTR